MIDLHCHLLPGIDDGPATLAESLQLAQLAVADGITHSIVTPHIHPGRWENSVEIIDNCRQQLIVALSEADIPLALGRAAEVRLSERVIELIAAQQVPFYGALDDDQVMLLEFPHGHVLPGSEQLVKWLRAHHIRPLLAHPERNREIMRDPDRLLPFLGAGCLLQVTGGSLLGRFGERALSVALQLLDQDMIFAIASDGHNAGARPPVLSEAYACVVDRCDEERAQRLFVENPTRLVHSQFSDLSP